MNFREIPVKKVNWIAELQVPVAGFYEHYDNPFGTAQERCS
jgi:hypothetical protein